MNKRQILINAIMSIIQVIIIGGTLFILYKFLLITIGVEQLGIWSLVLATTSVTKIADFGISASVVKFVAKYIARGENENVSNIIQTATFSVAIFVGFFLLIGYPIAKGILRLIISYGSFPIALSVLPYAFLALWSMVVTSIFQAGLDGCQRIDLRSFLLMGGAIIHLILCFIFAPRYGLIGVAYASVVSNIIILFSSWFLLRKLLPLLPILPYKWNKYLFKEIVGYGINFQIISVSTMLYDPITKALLSKFGGLSVVGYYEMASRMIIQFRALIVSANQVLVPVIAGFKEKTPEKIKSVYLISYQLFFYLAVPLYSLILICIPIISQLWIGYYERTFVIFAILLSIGWFFNTLNVPSYFSYLGIGELRWNLMGHVIIGLLNFGVGFLLGIFYDGIGVVIGWVFSLILGSSIICLSYHIIYKIPLTELLPNASKKIVIACLFSILFSYIIRYTLSYKLDTFILNGIIIFLFCIIIFIPLWFHPMKRCLMEWATYELLNRNIEGYYKNDKYMSK